MLTIIVIPLIICIFNIYSRFTCVVKAKFTKITLFASIFVLLILLFLSYKVKNDFVGYLIVISWWLSYFTSLVSAGITENGFIHPWQLIAKLYKWKNIRKFSIEKKDNTIMINFKAIRDLRQEYDKKDFEKIKKILKNNKLI